MPERFAIDFVKLGPDGKTFHGDEHVNKSYYAYGLPVAAVADGQIESVADGIAENVPNSGRMAAQLTVATLAGNDVVEKIGDGRYAGYAHLIPGSIKVKPGEIVHRGQILGLLGNSGNSTEPHLHFQVCNGPTFLECDGIPQEFRKFTLETYKIEKPAGASGRLAISGRRSVNDQCPLEDELIAFPADK